MKLVSRFETAIRGTDERRGPREEAQLAVSAAPRDAQERGAGLEPPYRDRAGDQATVPVTSRRSQFAAGRGLSFSANLWLPSETMADLV